MKHTRRLKRQQSRRSGRSRRGRSRNRSGRSRSRSGRSRSSNGGNTDLLLESRNYFLRNQNYGKSIFPLFTTGSPAREEYDKAMTEIKRIVEKYKIKIDKPTLYKEVNDFGEMRTNLSSEDIQQIVDLIDYIIRARNSKRTSWLGNFKHTVVRPMTPWPWQ